MDALRYAMEDAPRDTEKGKARRYGVRGGWR